MTSTGRANTVTLLLLRHAKSAWDRPNAADHDRDLAPRGVRAAERIGLEIARLGMPELVLCSTALRARRTWELAGAAGGVAPPCQFLRNLYLAEPDTLLRLIREQPASVRRLMVVGHNPGMHALATALAGSGCETDLSALASKLPTGSMVAIAFDGADWAGVDGGVGRLLAFIRPRDLD